MSSTPVPLPYLPLPPLGEVPKAMGAGAKRVRGVCPVQHPRIMFAIKLKRKPQV